MDNQSTSKILAKMHGRKGSGRLSSLDLHDDEDRAPAPAIPQLAPENEMEHVLANMLGASKSKDNTPMD